MSIKRFLSGLLVSALMAATAFGAANVYQGASGGDWFADGNWSLGHAPTADEDVVIDALSVKAAQSIVAGSLAITGAGGALTLGNASSRPNVTATVSGDMSVANGATLTVYAGEIDGFAGSPDTYPSTFSDAAAAKAAIYANANIVSVGGALYVTNGATVYPDGAPISGTPVFFRAADVTLSADSTFDARQRGWGWSGRDWSTHPDGAKPRTNEGKTIQPGWTLAFGSGLSYGAGGGYGGAGAGAGNKETDAGTYSYGQTYATSFAPFLLGAPAGYYQTTARARGSGSICLFATGTAEIAGTLNADAASTEHGGASGGGIWVAAATLNVASTAVLTANGMGTSSTAYMPGGGGRIALLNRLTGGFATLDTLAGLDTLPSDYASSAISGCTVSVAPGARPDASMATAGTAVTVQNAVELSVHFAGTGSVTVGDDVYTEDFSVLVTTKDGITLDAAGTGGSSFVSWEGALISGGVAETSRLTFTPEADGTITVNFANGAVKRAWTGAAGGSWLSPLNWSPAGTPGSTDELYLTNASVTVASAVSFGKLVFAGASAVAFNAAALPDGMASTTNNIRDNATVVTVTGELAFDDTTAVTVANDAKTGAAVRFDVGSFRLAEGASVSADGKGWYWYKSSGDTLAKYTQGSYQCRAMGAGYDYSRGAGHGARGGNSSLPWCDTYGYKYAPFLPGSPNGLYQGYLDRGFAGGGTIWIRCAGLCALSGTISANGLTSFYGAPSGGSIWIAARGFQVSATAALSANAGELKGTSYASYGAGGRISLAIGLTDAQLDALADGETPEGLTYTDAIEVVAATAQGSCRNKSGAITYGPAGTLTTVKGALAYTDVSVSGSPVNVRGCVPACGSSAFEPGTVQTFTAPEYGVYVDDARYRYACDGYAVSNASGQVAYSETGRSVDVTIANGPLSVTWFVRNPQVQVLLRKPAHGALAVGGVTQSGDVSQWSAGTMTPVTAVPDDDYEFVCWEGNVPLGTATQNPFQVAITEPLDATPVFRLAEAAATRTWSGTGVWSDTTMWTPSGNIPGPLDTVVIASGSCKVSNCLAVAQLEVQGGSLCVGGAGNVNGELKVAGNAALTGGTVVLGVDMIMTGHAAFTVGGDLTLSSTAELDVYGGPVTADYTFAGGCSFVTVAGTFALTETSVFRPFSDMYTGGSVKVTAGSFTVAEGAAVNATGTGYMWTASDRPPDSPGVGGTFSMGASHGGRGGCNSEASVYGQQLAPKHPGSPNGCHEPTQAGLSYVKRGGGLVRVHAGSMSVSGAITADAPDNFYGGASGGGIWLTANRFAFAPTATLSAHGGSSNYDYSLGGGGRIAIEGSLTSAQIAALAETGTAERLRRMRDQAAFEAAYPGVTVSVIGGRYNTTSTYGNAGTFVFLPQVGGLALLFR